MTSRTTYEALIPARKEFLRSEAERLVAGNRFRTPVEATDILSLLDEIEKLRFVVQEQKKYRRFLEREWQVQGHSRTTIHHLPPFNPATEVDRRRWLWVVDFSDDDWYSEDGHARWAWTAFLSAWWFLVWARWLR
jgi:hypothetical protein